MKHTIYYLSLVAMEASFVAVSKGWWTMFTSDFPLYWLTRADVWWHAGFFILLFGPAVDEIRNFWKRQYNLSKIGRRFTSNIGSEGVSIS